jgi:hypothetical protein
LRFGLVVAVFVIACMFVIPNVERYAGLSYNFLVTVEKRKLIYFTSAVYVALIIVVFSQKFPSVA